MKKPVLQLRESILLSLVLVGSMIVYQRMWYATKSAQLTVVHAQRDSLKKEVDANKLILSGMATRAPASEEMKTSHLLLDRYLKSNGRFSNAITGIISQSKVDSFNLLKLSADGQTKVGGYTQTLHTLEAEGSFISIGRFLEKIEDSPLLTEVQSVDVQRIAGEMKRCKTTIKLYSYVLGGEQ